jgi:hypothetical protein
MGSGLRPKISNGRATTGRPGFEQLINHYDRVCPDELETRNLASDYRKIWPDALPNWVHYEFLDKHKEGKIGIEIHVEKRGNAELERTILDMIPEMEKLMDGRIFEYVPTWREIPKWNDRSMKVSCLVPNDIGDEAITNYMLSLISSTKDIIGSKLG